MAKEHESCCQQRWWYNTVQMIWRMTRTRNEHWSRFPQSGCMFTFSDSCFSCAACTSCTWTLLKLKGMWKSAYRHQDVLMFHFSSWEFIGAEPAHHQVFSQPSGLHSIPSLVFPIFLIPDASAIVSTGFWTARREDVCFVNNNINSRSFYVNHTYALRACTWLYKMLNQLVSNWGIYVRVEGTYLTRTHHILY